MTDETHDTSAAAVDRYNPKPIDEKLCSMAHHDLGCWVSYSDYRALARERDTLAARLAEVEAGNGGLVRLNEATQKRAEAAEAKLAVAREALVDLRKSAAMLAPRDGMGMHLPSGQAAHLPEVRRRVFMRRARLVFAAIEVITHALLLSLPLNIRHMATGQVKPQAKHQGTRGRKTQGQRHNRNTA